MSDVIEEKKVNNNGWISINDISPDSCVDLLVCDVDGTIYVAHRLLYSEEFMLDNGDKVKDVKWWRPLPEKPIMINSETETVVKVDNVDEWFQEVLRCTSCDRSFMLDGCEEGIIGCYCPYCGKKIVKKEEDE